MDLRATLRRLAKKRLFKFGLPFFVFVIGGSFGLREFTQIKYIYGPVTAAIRDEVEKEGIEIKKPGEVTLETEYEKVKKLDIDNWENVRIPRPWEKDGKIL